MTKLEIALWEERSRLLAAMCQVGKDVLASIWAEDPDAEYARLTAEYARLQDEYVKAGGQLG